MTFAKRIFDLVIALLLAVILALPFALLLLWLLLRDGRPLFYLSERMKTPDQPFRLWKLRTMTVVSEAQNTGVSGADKAARVTATGRLLRRFRLDEIPQLWNVIRGDMSFVGPRPPLRLYTERFPALYAEVLKTRPGITGLASLVFHRHEERLLQRGTTPEETDAIYSRHCVPRKAALDLIYLRHRSVCYDLVLMFRTVAKVAGRRK